MADRSKAPVPERGTEIERPLLKASDVVRTEDTTRIASGRSSQRAAGVKPGDTLSARYLLGRVLGVGAFGQVFSAWDQERSRFVAIKVLKNTHPSALLRFKKEFRAISEIRHPNLIRVFELGRDGERWYIVMEKLQGVPFVPIMVASRVHAHDANDTNQHGALTTILTHINRAPNSPAPTATSHLRLYEPTIPVQVLRDYFQQLARGAQALHALNIVHCDLKPSNIMVTPDDRVVILDLGVVRHMIHLAAQNQADGMYAGTRFYMAPEISSDGPLTPAVDWYAVGVILWQFLTSQDASTLDRASEAQYTAFLQEFGAQYPAYAALAEVCARLLRSDPEERAAYDDVLAVCAEGPAQNDADTQPATQASFVGRNQELALLHQAWTAFNDGRPQAVVVEGHSGAGKSALCANFLHDIQRTEPFVRVLLARCKSNESLGFRAFDELVDGLTAIISQMSEDERSQVLPLCTPVLCRLFPVLKSLDPALEDNAYAPMTSSDPRFALRELLCHVAARYSLIIWIEDIESADEDSLQWIGQIFTPALRPNAFLLLTQSTRAPLHDDRFDIDILGYAIDRIALMPMDRADAHQLIRELLPASLEKDTALIERIEEVAGGLPEMLEILCSQTDDARQLEGAATGHALLVERIGALSGPQFDILAAAAVSSHAQPTSVLSFVTEQRVGETSTHIDALLDTGMLQALPGEEHQEYQIAHAAIRASVLTLLSTEQTRVLHAAMVHASDQLPACQMRDLTLLSHMLRSGMVHRAQADGVRFAKIAEETGAYAAAAKIYTQLIDMQRARDMQTSKALRMRAAELNLRAGQLLDGANLFAELANEATSIDEEQTLRERAEKNYLLCGHLEKSREQRQKIDAKKFLFPVLRPPRTANILVLRQHIMRSMRRFDIDSLRVGTPRQNIDAKMRTFRMVGLDMGIVDPVVGLEYAMQELSLALQTKEPIAISRVLAGLSQMFASTGEREKALGLAWTELAMELGRRGNDEVSVQWARICQANIDYQAGNYHVAWAKLDAGRNWFEQNASTQSMMLVYANSHLIYCAWAMGKIPELRAAYYGQLGDVRARRNRVLEAGISVGGFNTWLIDDTPDAAKEALKRLDIPPTGGPFRLLDFLTMYYGGEIALYTQQYDVMDATIRALWRFETTLLCRVVEQIRNAARFLHARLLIARAAHTGNGGRRLFVQLQIIGRQLRKSEEILGQGWGHQILGASYLFKGQRHTAAPHYRRAITLFENADIRIFAEPTRAAAAVLGILPCDDDPFERLREMGVVDPLKYTRITHPNV